jgi:ankyrin repeat protein
MIGNRRFFLIALQIFMSLSLMAMDHQSLLKKVKYSKEEQLQEAFQMNIFACIADPNFASIIPSLLSHYFEKYQQTIFFLRDNTNGNMLIHALIDQGYSECVKDLVAKYQHGASTKEHCINFLNNDGQTALHRAVIGSHLEIIEFLLSVKTSNEYGYATRWCSVVPDKKNNETPLSYINMESNNALAILESLLPRYYELTIAIPYSHLLSMAIRASNADVIEYLVTKNEVELLIQQDITYLFMVVCYRNLRIFNAFIRAGAPVNTIMPGGQLLIHNLIKNKNHQLLQSLLQNNHVNLKDRGRSKATPLTYAISNGDKTSVELLLDSDPELVNYSSDRLMNKGAHYKAALSGNRDMLLTILRKNNLFLDAGELVTLVIAREWKKNQDTKLLPMIRMLVRYGACLKTESKDKNVLQEALLVAFSGNELIMAILNNDQNKVRSLLKDASFEQYDVDKATALMYAAVQGNLPMVNILLESDNIVLFTATVDGDTVLNLLDTILLRGDNAIIFKHKMGIADDTFVKIKELIIAKMKACASGLLQLTQNSDDKLSLSTEVIFSILSFALDAEVFKSF